MKLYRSVLSNLVFFLQVILVLALIFHRQLTVPVWLQPAGRLHPLILHLPITLILLLPALLLFRKKPDDQGAVVNIFSFVLLHAAFFATLSALSGLFLSTEGGYEEDLLNRHMYVGAITAFLTYALLLTVTYFRFKTGIINSLLVLNCTGIIIGSHFGGTITHGENYLSGLEEETNTKPRKPVTDSSAIFEAAVQPVLESKCYSCHNEKKAKGELIMTDVQKMLEGGKDGPLWVAGDPLNSHIIKRLLLDPSDKKHMPPKGKPQLSEREIQLLEAWIRNGASLEKSFRDYEVADSFRVFAASFVQQTAEVLFDTTTYRFPPADEKLLAKMVNPYRTITPRSSNSPALDVSFYVSQNYNPELLREIKSLKTQVVSINLSNMPVKDDALKEIGQFPNLEHLFLNGTSIDGTGLSDLKNCTKLRTVSLANTRVTSDKLKPLTSLPSLKKVFLWSSGVREEEIKILENQYPGITWDRGFVADSTEKLKLIAPMVSGLENRIIKTGDSVILRHPLPGAEIRYTLDGTDPDSTTSAIYSKPIPISKPTTIKARAVLPGWFSSNVVEFLIFTEGIKPSDVILVYEPDPKYRLQGAKSLTDRTKGESNNTYIGWLGFREKPFHVLCTFEKEPMIREVVVSAGDNYGLYLFPPQSIVVKGGNDSTNLKVIGTLKPEQPTKYGPSKIKAHIVPVIPGNYRFIKIEALNVQSLPEWHSGKKQKGWIFVDEIFFN